VEERARTGRVDLEGAQDAHGAVEDTAMVGGHRVAARVLDVYGHDALVPAGEGGRAEKNR